MALMRNHRLPLCSSSSKASLWKEKTVSSDRFYGDLVVEASLYQKRMTKGSMLAEVSDFFWSNRWQSPSYLRVLLHFRLKGNNGDLCVISPAQKNTVFLHSRCRSTTFPGVVHPSPFGVGWIDRLSSHNRTPLNKPTFDSISRALIFFYYSGNIEFRRKGLTDVEFEVPLFWARFLWQYIH